MTPRMKGQALERAALDRLAAALREVPFLDDADVKRESTRGDSRVDFVLGIRGAATDRRLVCEVKSSGQPRIAREACLNLSTTHVPTGGTIRCSSPLTSPRRHRQFAKDTASVTWTWRATAAWRSIRSIFVGKATRTRLFRSVTCGLYTLRRLSEFSACFLHQARELGGCRNSPTKRASVWDR